MIISHNLMAMNTKRQLGITNKSKAKSTEKLSSGYKINRAADDAAGLAISEKMRRQIRGLRQASSNAQDGISLVQIADGAMSEIHDMLHRGTELSIKAANGTLSDDDRAYIQEELDQIIKEIDSISVKTLFNEIPVLLAQDYNIAGDIALRGSMPSWVDMGSSLTAKYMNDVYTTTEGYNEIDSSGNPTGVTGSVSITHDAAILDFNNFTGSAAQMNELIGSGFYSTCCTCDRHYSIEFVDELPSNSKMEQSGSHYIYKVGIQGITSVDDLLDTIVAATNNGNPNNHYTKIVADKANKQLIVYDDRSNTANPVTPASGNTIQWTGWSYPQFNVTAGIGRGLFGEGVAYKPENTAKYKKDLFLHVGADAGDKLHIELPSVSSKVLGISNVNVKSLAGAQYGITAFDKAVKYLNTERSRMGAYQNRLEHTINNLDNVVENTQAAESAIRDTDMAKEMVRFSNYNILGQAGQSMLAQANQTPQGIISLLQ